MKKSLSLLIVFVGFGLCYQYARGFWYPLASKFMSKQTVSDVIHQYGEQAKQSLEPDFVLSGVHYPPQKLALVAFKDSNELEIWAANEGADYVLVKRYPIQAASGVPGPKLKEGDKQVPEGHYKIIAFNPNSAYHLSMKLNYPNAFDLKYAEAEGRNEPGSNIFIHGKAVSVGCLAMGDKAIEQLFSLVHATGLQNTSVLISPTDPSKNTLIVPKGAPAWTRGLYQNIEFYYSQINSDYVL